MIQDKSEELYIKNWIIKKVDKICDADSEALSSYMVALLKDNATKERCVDQFGDFLKMLAL